MRAEIARTEAGTHDPLARVVAYAGLAPLCVKGPAASGKTAALAARALRIAGEGAVVVVCPNAASVDAFLGVLDRSGDRPAHQVDVDTLAGHAVRWMREDPLSSGASPQLSLGGDAASEALARRAGAAILDMSWPGFRSPAFTLDLPFLGRPEIFFEEAAALFRQLRRAGVAPETFEAQTQAGIGAFYGDDVERASALCADRAVRSRASGRGREALSADASRLRVQKRAERELVILLAYLYREYCAGACNARVLCPEDAIDETVLWLQRDPAAARRVAQRYAGLIVDDAEDAEPAAALIIELLRQGGLSNVAVASSAQAAIDGTAGMRALILADNAAQIELSPPAVLPARPEAHRFDDEDAEGDAVARRIGDLIRGGTPPSAILVLARDSAAARVYAELLAARGVPVVAPPDGRQAPHDIADLLALAAIVDDPYDHASLLRVLASPLVGLSDFSLLTLCRDPVDAGQLALDVVDDEPRVGAERGPVGTTLAENVLYGHADLRLTEHARASLAAFRSAWSQWRRTCSGMHPARSLAYLADAAGFRAAWHAAPAYARSRLADDCARLVSAASRTETASLRETARALGEGLLPIEEARDATDAIACRTIAGSKGVRKSYAFVVGIAYERFPRLYVSRGMAYSKNYGLIVRENVAGGASQNAKFAWYYARFGAKQLFLEQERRAMHYALSRADVASFASGFGRPPRWAASTDLLAEFGV